MYSGRLRPVFLKSEDDQIWEHVSELMNRKGNSFITSLSPNSSAKNSNNIYPIRLFGNNSSNTAISS